MPLQQGQTWRDWSRARAGDRLAAQIIFDAGQPESSTLLLVGGLGLTDNHHRVDNGPEYRRTHLMAQLSLKTYFKNAAAVIGKRTPGQIAYDNELVRWLKITKDFRAALAKANQRFPSEALNPKAGQWVDLEARYEYIRNHEEIVRRLRR